MSPTFMIDGLDSAGHGLRRSGLGLGGEADGVKGVAAGLVPATHAEGRVLLGKPRARDGVDARDKRGHDGRAYPPMREKSATVCTASRRRREQAQAVEAQGGIVGVDGDGDEEGVDAARAARSSARIAPSKSSLATASAASLRRGRQRLGERLLLRLARAARDRGRRRTRSPSFFSSACRMLAARR